MEALVPLPARVQTMPRRSSLQHEYDALHMRTAKMAMSAHATQPILLPAVERFLFLSDQSDILGSQQINK